MKVWRTRALNRPCMGRKRGRSQCTRGWAYQEGYQSLLAARRPPPAALTMGTWSSGQGSSCRPAEVPCQTKRYRWVKYKTYFHEGIQAKTLDPTNERWLENLTLVTVRHILVHLSSPLEHLESGSIEVESSHTIVRHNIFQECSHNPCPELQRIT